jgi:hypothetical protein
MTAAELIERLRGLPQDADVWVEANYDGTGPVKDVRVDEARHVVVIEAK